MKRLLLTALVGMLWTPQARAYHVPIHEMFPERALHGDARLKDETLPAVAPQDLEAFRAWLDGLGRNHPDEKVRAEYLKRYPTPAAFDVAAFKRLMQFNSTTPVNGWDKAEGLPGSPMKVLQVASGQPDTDKRNMDRLALDDKGAPRTLPDGRKVPEDPIVLNMGNVTGRSSQAHAHYGLMDAVFTTDPEMLRTDPRRFAAPFGWPKGPVKTLAREMTQAHYDLAVLASLWNTPAGRSLGYLYLGQAFHYLQDVGNQIHTVQVGSHDFFVQAKVLTTTRAITTLGGYLGDLRPFTAVGLEILTAHHHFAEALNRKRMLEAVDGKANSEALKALASAMGVDEPEYKKDVEMAVAQLVSKAGKKHLYLPMATVIMGRLIEHSSREGGEVYRHTAGVSVERLKQPGAKFEEGDDPDPALADVTVPEVQAHLESLYWLQAKGMARAAGAMRLLFTRFNSDVTVEDEAKRAERVNAVAGYFLASRLKELTEQEARLQMYLADPPPAVAATVKDPFYLLAPFGVVGIIAALVVFFLRCKPEPPAEGNIASYG
jgi:hypothetical protein